MKFEHIELTDRVYLRVKKMIFDQELIPGQKILQEKLSAELGVSRTPLLKALHRLENELLVESLPRRGLYVKELKKQEIIDIFECRAVIEGLSARLTAETIDTEQLAALRAIFTPFKDIAPIDYDAYSKADRQFHDRIMKLSQNAVIPRLEMLSNIHLLAYQVGLLRPPEETLPDHFAIIDAIADHNGQLAEQRMRDHIITSLDAYRQET